MKLNMFINSTFQESDGSTTVTARLRNVANSKSFKLKDFPTAVEKHDGVEIEVSGEVTAAGNYVTPASYKLVGEPVKGAYTPRQTMAVEDYLASLTAPETDAPHPADDIESPF